MLREFSQLISPASLPPAQRTVENTAALLCRSLRLFDSDCVRGLPADDRAALHAHVINVCIAANMQAVLACYCVTHGIATLPPVPDRPWVAVLAVLLSCLEEPAEGTAPPTPRMLAPLFAGLDVTTLADRPALLLACAAATTDTPATLVGADNGWSEPVLRRTFADNPAVLALFGLGASDAPQTPSLAAVAEGNLAVPLTSVFDRVDCKESMTPFLEEMAQRFSSTDTLDVRYYLQQGRAMAAWNSLGPQPAAAVDEATVMTVAIENFTDVKVTSACMMLLRCKLGATDPRLTVRRLRDYVDVAQRIHAYELQQFGSALSKFVCCITGIHTYRSTFHHSLYCTLPILPISLTTLWSPYILILHSLCS